MNVNLKLETGQYCYVYSSYKIEKIKDKKYIMPEENATKKMISVTEHIDNQLISLLNIGKRAYFYEDNIDADIINFANNYGLLGFMADMPLNKFYILDDEVFFKDYNYNTSTSAISKLTLEEYAKLFMKKLNKREIHKILTESKAEIYTAFGDIEKSIAGNVNEKLIYSIDYAEPVDVIIYYARDLYKSLYELADNQYTVAFPSVSNISHISTNIQSLSSGKLELNLFYLKQAIDLYFSILLAQDTRLLKICNFCNRAFIANNPKAEYDTPQCKNKANVYKSRGKDLPRNVIRTEDGLMAKMPSKDLSDAIIKSIGKRWK